jgi:hypothetical protein
VAVAVINDSQPVWLESLGENGTDAVGAGHGGSMLGMPARHNSPFSKT